jgi:MSHA biogenesis protein MshL
MSNNTLRMAVLAAITSLTVGCVTVPQNVNPFTATPTPELARTQAADGWSNIPAVSVAPGMTGMSVSATYPVPERIRDKKVDFSFPSKATLSHLVTLLNHAGIRVSIAEEHRNKRLETPSFKGPLIDLLDYLSVSLDVAYEYRRGTLRLGSESSRTVVVPQNADFMAELTRHITALGATRSTTDVNAGLITFVASPAAMDDIALYLDRVTKNAAMINMQIAVIDLRLDREYGQGLDWSRLMASGFSKENAGVVRDQQGLTIETDSFVGTLTGQSASLLTLGENFSLDVALDLLSTYGETRTDQNLLLSTIAGAPVKISSGSIIPYVSEIGTSASEGVSQQSAETDTVESGLKVEVTPRYDASTGVVTTEINVNMSALIAMRQLNAGVGIGELSQPEMQEMSFSNQARLQPGDTVVLGGVVYDSVTDDYSTLTGFERSKVGHKAHLTDKRALFIVMRPTVQVPGLAQQRRVVPSQIHDPHAMRLAKEAEAARKAEEEARRKAEEEAQRKAEEEAKRQAAEAARRKAEAARLAQEAEARAKAEAEAREMADRAARARAAAEEQARILAEQAQSQARAAQVALERAQAQAIAAQAAQERAMAEAKAAEEARKRAQAAMQ